MGRNEYGIARQKLGLPTVKLRLAAAAMDENILPVGIAGKDKGAAAFIQRTFYRFDQYIEPIGNRRAPLPVHDPPSSFHPNVPPFCPYVHSPPINQKCNIPTQKKN